MLSVSKHNCRLPAKCAMLLKMKKNQFLNVSIYLSRQNLDPEDVSASFYISNGALIKQTAFRLFWYGVPERVFRLNNKYCTERRSGLLWLV
jgi:hypothetical protein